MNPLTPTRRHWTAWLAMAAVFLLPGMAGAADRAVWTWEKDSYAMLDDPAQADDAIAFLRAKRIGTIYLYADAYRERNLIRDQPQKYRAFIRLLHRRGLRAYALLGSAYLHTEEYMLPERREVALAMFRQVLDYNRSARPSERFDGINLDIEPHILDAWPEQKMQLLAQFLDLGAAFMQLKRESGVFLQVGPAIPFWLDGIELDWHGRKQRVSDHVIDTYDYVALMDYRDHADGGDGIISHAMDELQYAARRKRRVVIGVEVTPNEITKVSFDHLTEADMERELALAQKAFRKQPAFAGFAIHHFRGYRKWLGKGASTD